MVMNVLRDEDEMKVGVAEDIRTAGFAAVELPLLVRPTQAGTEAAMAMVGGIEELTRVTADEERALKLCTRPRDPLCRPLVAQRDASDDSSFVFRVKRRRLRPKGVSTEAAVHRREDGKVPAMTRDGALSRWRPSGRCTRTSGLTPWLMCRPKDEDMEKAIEEHIAAAAARTEPIELVPHSFLPPFPRVLVESTEEKVLRREKRQNEAVRLDRAQIQVYHRFGEGVKHRTKKGLLLIKEARAILPLKDQLLANKESSKLKKEKISRPSRFKKGISGHNEVKEQELLIVLRIIDIFERRPMYFMRELDNLFQGEAVWSLRDLVPSVAYYYVNGPWRSRWVRFGYRPEDDPSTRFDQLLEFRLSAAQLRSWAESLGYSRGNDKAGRGMDAPAALPPSKTSKPNAGDGLGEKELEGSGEERGDLLCKGGVVPVVRLTSKAKGRFSSQVVLNGETLSARNRHVYRDSPFRTVQELALTSPRLEAPNSLTGWWPPALVYKMRVLTLEGIHGRVKAMAAETALKSAARLSQENALEKSSQPPVLPVGSSSSSNGSTSRSFGIATATPQATNERASKEDGLATTPASAPVSASASESKATSGTQIEVSNTAAAPAPAPAAAPAPAPTLAQAPAPAPAPSSGAAGGGEGESTVARGEANLTTDEFTRRAMVESEKVEVLPAAQETGAGGGVFPDEGRGGGGAGFPVKKKARAVGAKGGRAVARARLSAVRRISVGRDSAEESKLVMQDADRIVVDSSDDDDSESDDLNSDDLVDNSDDDAYSGGGWEEQEDEEEDIDVEMGSDGDEDDPLRDGRGGTPEVAPATAETKQPAPKRVRIGRDASRRK